jgi:hypothetical protein
MKGANTAKTVPGTGGTDPLGTGGGTDSTGHSSTQVTCRIAVPGTGGNQFPRRREPGSPPIGGTGPSPAPFDDITTTESKEKP